MKSGGTKRPVLVIGYGSALRDDDGAGPAAARRLERILSPRSAVVLAMHQLLPELAEPVSRARYVIFIDAHGDAAPGQIRRRPVPRETDWRQAMTHDLTAAGIVALAMRLYGRAPRAALYSIGGATFGYGRRLSPAVRRGLDELVRRIAADVRRHASVTPPPR